MKLDIEKGLVNINFSYESNAGKQKGRRIDSIVAEVGEDPGNPNTALSRVPLSTNIVRKAMGWLRPSFVT